MSGHSTDRPTEPPTEPHGFVIAAATDASIAAAAERLSGGGVVAFPTETVYGLGAATLDPVAIERVYALKGRPADNPLIAHVADAAGARGIVAGWPERAEALASAFWPGPLTLVLPRAAHVPAAAAGGRDSLAVRAPDHAVAQALLAAFGGAISAPSANRSGHVSPTTAAHVEAEFAGADLMILDGGPCAVGIESTVLDLTGPVPRVLRPGSVTAAQLEAVVGPVDAPALAAQSASPGTALRHYAPRTPALVLDPDALRMALARPGAPACAAIVRTVPVAPPHLAVTMPIDEPGYARELYAALRRADAEGRETILIEAVPDDDAWAAVRDRLRRATA